MAHHELNCIQYSLMVDVLFLTRRTLVPIAVTCVRWTLLSVSCGCKASSNKWRSKNSVDIMVISGTSLSPLLCPSPTGILSCLPPPSRAEEWGWSHFHQPCRNYRVGCPVWNSSVTSVAIPFLVCTLKNTHWTLFRLQLVLRNTVISYTLCLILVFY